MFRQMARPPCFIVLVSGVRESEREVQVLVNHFWSVFLYLCRLPSLVVVVKGNLRSQIVTRRTLHTTSWSAVGRTMCLTSQINYLYMPKMWWQNTFQLCIKTIAKYIFPSRFSCILMSLNSFIYIYIQLHLAYLWFSTFETLCYHFFTCTWG